MDLLMESFIGVWCSMSLKMIYWNYEMNGKKDQLKIGYNSGKNSAMV
jgi:hypothetical protein